MKKYGMDKYKTIGVIGGQGPASTIDFYERVIKYFQTEFGARYVRDYPKMIIYSVPTPDLVEGVESEEKTFKIMSEAIYGLEREKVDFVVITCISLQYFIARLQPLVVIPIIPLSPLLARQVKEERYKKVGILATQTTLLKRICHKDLEKIGVKVVEPDNASQDRIGEVVLDVIGGKITEKDYIIINEVIDQLYREGADAIMFACTELPLLLGHIKSKLPVVDCNELYPKLTAEYSSGRIKLQINGGR
jgi:aspartate racemase